MVLNPLRAHDRNQVSCSTKAESLAQDRLASDTQGKAAPAARGSKSTGTSISSVSGMRATAARKHFLARPYYIFTAIKPEVAPSETAEQVVHRPK